MSENQQQKDWRVAAQNAHAPAAAAVIGRIIRGVSYPSNKPTTPLPFAQGWLFSFENASPSGRPLRYDRRCGNPWL